MCGRFVSASSPERIAEHFGAAFAGESLGESYNVAPTDDIYGIVAGADGTLRLEVFHWGLIPTWATDRKVGQKMINARAETLATKPAFKGVFRQRRCIIPMDGFYEWRAATRGGPVTKAGKPVKQPVYAHRPDGSPLAVAGLWSTWKDDRDPAGQWLHSAVVVTTPANATMGAVHDRMPAVLAETAWRPWLDPTNEDLDALAGLLVPAADSLLVVEPVGPAVNNVRNQGPELIEPVPPESGHGSCDGAHHDAPTLDL